MGDTATTLNQAYQLIEQGELAQARALLQPLLISDADNADVWWLYTHAAEDRLEGQRALDRVVALHPDYPGATELRQQLGETTIKPSLKPLAPPVATPPAVEEFDEDFDDAEAVQPPRRSPVVWAVVAVVVLAVAAVAALFLSQALQLPTTATPTQVADATGQVVLATDVPLTTPEIFLPLATDEILVTDDVSSATEEVELATVEPANTEVNSPTEEVALATATSTMVVRASSTPAEQVMMTEEVIEPTPTREIIASSTPVQISIEVSPTATDTSPATVIGVTAQSASGGYDALYDALVSFNVAPDSISTKATRLGNTLVVRACGVPGPAASRVLTGIMDIMTQQIGTYGAGIEALGVNISDCDQTSDGRIVAVPMGTAGAYARKEIDARIFQSFWQPVE